MVQIKTCEQTRKSVGNVDKSDYQSMHVYIYFLQGNVATQLDEMIQIDGRLVLRRKVLVD